MECEYLSAEFDESFYGDVVGLQSGAVNWRFAKGVLCVDICTSLVPQERSPAGKAIRSDSELSCGNQKKPEGSMCRP